MNGSERRSILVIPKNILAVENIILLTLIVSTIFSVDFVGRLLLSDFIVVIAFFILLSKKKISFRLPFLVQLLTLLFAWLLIAVLSDVLNASPWSNALRGWAKILLFGFYITVIFNLIRNDKQRASLAMFALAIAVILDIVDTNVDLASGEFRTQWKFGIGFGFFVLLSLLVQFITGRKRLASLSVFCVSPLSLFLGARSLFLEVFLASAISLFAVPIRNKKQRAKIGLVFLALLVGGLVIGQTVYDQVVRTGVFGEQALLKHQSQTIAGNSIILGARAESLVASIAIADAPFIGHGSWAEDREYRLLYFQLREERGESVSWESDFFSLSDLIPSHSMLLGAMVEHGFVGGIFWLYSLVLAVRGLVNGGLGKGAATTSELLAPIALIWDIFFSPFGATRRCSEAIFLAITVLLIRTGHQDNKL